MASALPSIELLASTAWSDYELLDSGGGQKLERFGPYIFSRPEHQAVWKRALPERQWKDAHGAFVSGGGDEMGGQWRFFKPVPDTWELAYGPLRFHARMSSSRHVGVFPEQATHWDWCAERIRESRRPLAVLNLFGYTGLATLACAAAGARVTHVDASTKAVSWARANQGASGMTERPIRWIVDDAVKFVAREGRRGARYDGLILDPPKFGRGPKGEIWDCFDMLPDLLSACRRILSPEPVFVVLTAYAIRASALSIHYALEETMAGLDGRTFSGELVTVERSAGRVLSNALYSRWQRLR